MELPGQSTPAVQRAFSDLAPHFDAISGATEALLDSLKVDSTPTDSNRMRLDTILAHEPEFLSRMHAIVGQYEAEARERVAGLQRFGRRCHAGNSVRAGGCAGGSRSSSSEDGRP